MRAFAASKACSHLVAAIQGGIARTRHAPIRHSSVRSSQQGKAQAEHSSGPHRRNCEEQCSEQGARAWAGQGQGQALPLHREDGCSPQIQLLWHS